MTDGLVVAQRATSEDTAALRVVMGAIDGERLLVVREESLFDQVMRQGLLTLSTSFAEIAKSPIARALVVDHIDNMVEPYDEREIAGLGIDSALSGASLFDALAANAVTFESSRFRVDHVWMANSNDPRTLTLAVLDDLSIGWAAAQVVADTGWGLDYEPVPLVALETRRELVDLLTAGRAHVSYRPTLWHDWYEPTAETLDAVLQGNGRSLLSDTST